MHKIFKKSLIFNTFPIILKFSQDFPKIFLHFLAFLLNFPRFPVFFYNLTWLKKKFSGKPPYRVFFRKIGVFTYFLLGIYQNFPELLKKYIYQWFNTIYTITTNTSTTYTSTTYTSTTYSSTTFSCINTKVLQKYHI